MRYKNVDQDQEIEDIRPKDARTSRHMTKTSWSKGLYVIFKKALWRTSADLAATELEMGVSAAVVRMLMMLKGYPSAMRWEIDRPVVPESRSLPQETVAALLCVMGGIILRVGIGCSGLMISYFLVIASTWNITDHHLTKANPSWKRRLGQRLGVMCMSLLGSPILYRMVPYCRYKMVQYL